MSHYRARTDVSYRSGADPAIVNYKGKYYLFVTRSHGYWVSDDMSNWPFIRPQSWYFNGSNAPAAAVKGDKLIVLGDPSGREAVIETDKPELGDWTTNFAVINVPRGVQDPALFVDEDGRVYLYEESSNKWPIHGIELDTANYCIPIGEQKALFNLVLEEHGWERFGQDHRSELKTLYRRAVDDQAQGYLLPRIRCSGYPVERLCRRGLHQRFSSGAFLLCSV